LGQQPRACRSAKLRFSEGRVSPTKPLTKAARRACSLLPHPALMITLSSLHSCSLTQHSTLHDVVSPVLSPHHRARASRRRPPFALPAACRRRRRCCACTPALPRSSFGLCTAGLPQPTYTRPAHARLASTLAPPPSDHHHPPPPLTHTPTTHRPPWSTAPRRERPHRAMSTSSLPRWLSASGPSSAPNA
jgi:hypothetical protein